jgi:hypothetical protein
MAQPPNAAETPRAQAPVSAPVVEHTPLAARASPRGWKYIRFRRWHSDGRTAYQGGQVAGFDPVAAERILGQRGVAIDVTAEAARINAASSGMITKGV